MPRWAEMVVIGVIGVVLIGALMVFAKYKMQQSAPAQVPAPAAVRASTDEVPPVAEAKPPVRAPPTLAEVEAAAASAVSLVVPSAPRVNPAPPPSPAPTPATAVAPTIAPSVEVVVAPAPMPGATGESVGTAAPAPVPALKATALGEAPGAEGVAAPAVPEGVVEPDKASEKPLDKTARVKPGSREELLLLAKAERTLKRLQSLRLRTDIPPAARENVELHLQAILKRLPPASRKQMQEWIAAGRQPALDPEKPIETGEASAMSLEIDARQVSKFDDTPPAVRNLRDNVTGLSRKLGVKRPDTTPASYGKVNPAVLPSAITPPTGTALPSAFARGLD